MTSNVVALEDGLAGEATLNAAPVLEVPLASETSTVNTTTQPIDSKAAPNPSTNDGEMTRVGSQDDHVNEKNPDKEANVADQPDDGILTGVRLLLVFIGMLLCVFLFALDQSIVATAIPVLVSDFHAFAQVGWVITGYFLTQSGFILLVGQSLTVFKAKWLLLVALFWFELGSLIAAVAPSMDVLIFGRAVQGVGCSGLFTCCMQIITVITPVHQRPTFMAGLGFAFIIASVVGPLLGGVFTQHVTWRWCFYINLPLGGISAVALVFLLPARPPIETPHTKGLTRWQKMARLDYVGAFLILAIVTCLLLALQWGGNNYSWRNWRIIFLFIFSGVLIGVFLTWNYVMHHKFHRALIPLDIVSNRTLIGGCLGISFTMLAFLGGVYEIPLYYEAVRNHSPTKAGIDQLPLMISIVVALTITGALSQKTGRYWPFLVVGPIIAAIGLGLLSSVDVDTSSSKLIGYQIMTGAGLGIYFQLLLLAVQAEFADKPDKMPQAVGLQTFAQLTGAALGQGIVNTVQSVYLNKELHRLASDVPFETVRESVSAIYTLPVAQQGPVVKAYVIAITKSYTPMFIAIGLTFLCVFLIKNHDIRKMGPAVGAAAA